jgi:3-oxoacyl-[acyl-carrier protein] reductase
MNQAHAGRCYIVTGGSRGLGYATAQVLVNEGARVLLVARDADRLESSVKALGAGAIGVQGDLADPQLAGEIVAKAIAEFGRLDGAFVSVGGPAPGSVLSTSDDAWRLAFESIFVGALRLVREVCGSLESGGVIGLVLSSSAKEVLPGLTISNGLRPGLAMLIKDLADEVGPRGIRVIGLLPGRIATDRIAEIDAAAGLDSRQRTEDRIPLRRYGSPDEFGVVAAFMLSEQASYVTGCLIPIDGGLLRTP